MAVTWRRLVLESDSNWVDLTDGGETTLHKHPETGINFTDVTTGNVSTTAHGYAPKAVASSSPTLNYLGIANGETSSAWKSASSNPGAAAAVLQTDAAGALTIGGLITTIDQPIFKRNNANRIWVYAYRDSASTHSGIVGAASRGTEASPSAILNGDMLMNFSCVGYNSSGAWSNEAGYFAVYAAGDFTSSASPTRMVFSVTPAGSTTLTQRMVLDQAGYLGIGTTSPSTRLDIDAGAIEIAEMTAPSAGAANTVRLFARDNGGKTELCAIFPTGAIQRVAIEP